jgi:hypothetical protein
MSGSVGHAGASSSLFLAQAYLNSDKPPYVRGSRYTQQEKKNQLEKGEFARLVKQQPTYRYVPGAKPPYERIQ